MHMSVGFPCADHQDYQACAVLMNHSGQLLHQYPRDQIQKIKQRRMAFLLAGTAAVHVHKGMTNHAASLHLAKKMLNLSAAAKEQLEAAVAQLQAGQTSGADVLVACSSDSGVMDAYTYLQEFHVAAHLKDAAWQEAILEGASHAPAVKADHLLMIAGVCKVEAFRYVHSCSAETCWVGCGCKSRGHGLRLRSAVDAAG